MDADDENGELLVYDTLGLVGRIEEVTLTGDGATELLVGTERDDYEGESWINRDAKLRTDGSIMISTPIDQVQDSE